MSCVVLAGMIMGSSMFWSALWVETPLGVQTAESIRITSHTLDTKMWVAIIIELEFHLISWLYFRFCLGLKKWVQKYNRDQVKKYFRRANLYHEICILICISKITLHFIERWANLPREFDNIKHWSSHGEAVWVTWSLQDSTKSET